MTLFAEQVEDTLPQMTLRSASNGKLTLMRGRGTNDEEQSITSSEGVKPVDRWNEVWLIMYLQGVGCLFPWNAFITPSNYFQLRFVGSPFEESFESIFTTTFTLFGLATIIALQWIQRYVPLRTRIIGALTTLFAVFLLVTALAVEPLLQADSNLDNKLKNGAVTHFVVLVACVGLSGVMAAVLNGESSPDRH